MGRPRELAALAKQLSARSFGPATAKYRELGTASNLLTFNRLNALPTRNFQQGSFAARRRPCRPNRCRRRARKTRASCAACTIGCEHIYRLDLARRAAGPRRAAGVRKPVRPGPLCGIGDPDVVLAASQRCDELGLDTISAGGTIAFAMECAERGLLDAPWLRFGDGERCCGASN